MFRVILKYICKTELIDKSVSNSIEIDNQLLNRCWKYYHGILSRTRAYRGARRVRATKILPRARGVARDAPRVAYQMSAKNELKILKTRN